MGRFKITKIAPSIFLLVLAVTPLHADNLLSVYEQAARNNFLLQSAHYDLAISKEEYNAAAAAYDPTVKLSLTPAYDFLKSNNRNASLDDSWKSGLEMEYGLDFRKSLYNNEVNATISSAGAEVQKQKYITSAQAQAFMVRTASAYFDVLNAKNRLDFSKTELSVIKKSLQQLRAQFRDQLATVTDIRETESRYSQAISTVNDAKTGLGQAVGDLQLLTRSRHGNLAGLNANAQVSMIRTGSLNDWLSLANRYNVDLVTARYTKITSEKEVDVSRSADGMSVDLFARYSGIVQSTKSEVNDPDDKQGRVGLEVNLPLYKGGATLARTRAAKLRLGKVGYELGIKKQEVAVQISQAFRNVVASKDNIRYLKRSVDSANSALNSVRLGRTAGTRTSNDVLRSLQELYSLQQEYMKSKYQFLLNIIRLKETAGVMSTTDLVQLNQLLTTTRPQTQMHQDVLPANMNSGLEKMWNSETGNTLESTWDSNFIK